MTQNALVTTIVSPSNNVIARREGVINVYAYTVERLQKLLEINPRTNIVFLTAYADYSFDAWQTGVSGFMLKPLTPEGVREQLQLQRYLFPIEGLDEGKGGIVR